MPDPLHPLFTLTARHRYFDGAECPSVTFRVVDPPPARVSKLGLILQPLTQSTLRVARRADAVDGDGAVDLLFEISSADPAFTTYTDLGGSGPGTTLWFDSTLAPPADAHSPQSLHAGASVSAADRLPRDNVPALRTVLQSATRQHGLGFVRIRLLPAEQPAKTWVITFDARAVIWEYVLVGASNPSVFIRDADGKIAFEPPVPTSLPDGRPAVVVRSAVALPLQQHGSVRFQLMEAAANGDRVVIPALPIATPAACAVETSGGHELVVARIWVAI